jgi:exodeoxyribonuclease V alpha subunit
MIQSGRFPTIILKRNFRQRKDSYIIENAFRIKEQKELMIRPYSPDLDFIFINLENEEQVVKKIFGILNYYKADYPYNSFELQILAPVYRGLVGIDNINRKIQEKYNESEILYEQQNRVFKKNDKIMQIRNNYDKGVFNGELGIIESVNRKEEVLLVRFDSNLIRYRFSELNQIVLAYTISIHKAQGSEFDLVVLLIHPSHYMMLNREIFYTAVTRAKTKLILISTKEAVAKSIKTSAPAVRRTTLEHYIRLWQKERKLVPN